MEKNRVLSHSPSLFDARGTEAFASQKLLLTVVSRVVLQDYQQITWEDPRLSSQDNTVHPVIHTWFQLRLIKSMMASTRTQLLQQKFDLPSWHIQDLEDGSA